VALHAQVAVLLYGMSSKANLAADADAKQQKQKQCPHTHL
jgi:hypothetical protein